MNIEKIITNGFNRAKNETQSIGVIPIQKMHQLKSRIWVESLATEFRDHYTSEDIKVFSKGYDRNRQDFKLNELLYDITVCSVGNVKSARHRKDISYVKKAIWQVESELALDSRAAAIDFSKLVLGSAENKMFIGPLMHDSAAYLSVLSPIAQTCDGNIYCVLIPHPKEEWGPNSSANKNWKFVGKDWVAL